ncbi:adenylate/guanylate cyclase domain-containing protein [Spirochaeta thermophila]|uniref:Guanylate cyclase domain-containing protein n=1 Tax=Winmispira thermophila (strain ATCC 49972 / DSM 6192 / RI 19.B1) TaxID=665571 RepID=E0RSQ2_WINT6|nr:adenylate/guanylate cyclase domain-containing protein [Spirochaeta thermophila]ADN02039.1 hypothetical protein STHERM_c10940 [Spirochaeta thermophila DSM 6192]
MKRIKTGCAGFLIATGIFLLFLLLKETTAIFDRWELKVLDTHFKLKTLTTSRKIKEGVEVRAQNPNISPDILIIGIDFRTLSDIGRWPFDRSVHAKLVSRFARIRDQQQRERALFLDIFFVEPQEEAFNDALLVKSIEENGRVFLDTVLELNPPPPAYEEVLHRRQETLFEEYGLITRIEGDWESIPAFYGLQPPLIPYGKAAKGYGHANFVEDYDKVFRRQPLIAKQSRLVRLIPLPELTTDFSIDRSRFERLAWVDMEGREHPIPYPLTEEILRKLQVEMEKKAPPKEIDLDGDGTIDGEFFVVRYYRDYFLPAITLSLALEYMHKRPSDVEVVLGEYIRIPDPQKYNPKTGEWEPYTIVARPAETDENGRIVKPAEEKTIHELRIPIDEWGNMIINYMGPPSSSDGYQTFPVRPYVGYVKGALPEDPSKGPRAIAPNKIIMVGPFAKGMAADEKPTPLGLMYGVEIHANALNTILMSQFIIPIPWWADIVFLLGIIYFIAFLSSRKSILLSAILTVLSLLVMFLAITVAFDLSGVLVPFSSTGTAGLFTFFAIVVYRVMTEERDKRRIREMFSKYVSPRVVDQLIDMESLPELGGVDKELTVFFSDIRGFTTLSETMTPQELVNHLNEYLTVMTDIILDLEGTLDKYVGDEIMCFWGAPIPQEDHALRACICAIRQMKALEELNAKWPPEKRLNIGIGINSGIMTVGNMGSPGRMNYTLMGDNVNLGARLEGTNKTYMTNIIISEYTYSLVKDKVIVRELDNIRVKGKNKPVLIYELIDVRDDS